MKDMHCIDKDLKVACNLLLYVVLPAGEVIEAHQVAVPHLGTSPASCFLQATSVGSL